MDVQTMAQPYLPTVSEDVLTIPATDVPNVVSTLLRRRMMSHLIRSINDDCLSPDPEIRAMGDQAARRLGFAD